MRIKQDKSNWQASAIMKRDFRHDSSQPSQTKIRSKKDTRKWCKGRVGVEHDYEYQYPKNEPFLFRLIAVCNNCEKQDVTQVLWWCHGHEDFEDHPSWKHENATLL